MSATQLVGTMEVLVPMADLIDKEAEQARLIKEVERLQKKAVHLAGKLGNENFVSKAPAEVVEKERIRLAEVESARTQLEEQLEMIRQL